ncbi:MAG: methyl-accepting chemotaxis protein [Leptospiraceae bacterium]|nr:methyl-accepting chemotaxis protein [Leptospiraceae bacterium]
MEDSKKSDSKNPLFVYRNFKTRYWLYTEGFGFLVTIPIVFFFVVFFGEFSYETILLLIKCTVISAPVNFTVGFITNHRLLKPLEVYFRELDSGRTVHKDIYEKALHRYSNLASLHAISPALEYLFSLLFIVIVFSFEPEVTITQYYNLVGSILAAVFICLFVYYNITEFLLSDFLKKGFLVIPLEKEKLYKKKLIYSLSGNIMLIIIIFSILTNLIIYNINYQSLKKSQISQILTINKNNVSIIDEFLKGYKEQLIQFSERPETKSAVTQKDKKWFKKELIINHFKGKQFLEEILLMSSDGNILYSSGDREQLDFPCRREMERVLKNSGSENFLVSTAFSSSISKEVLVLLTYPVRENDILIGLIGFSIEIHKFTSQFLNKVPVGENGYSIIVDKDFTVVSHPDPKLILFDSKKFPFGKRMVEAGTGDIVKYTFRGKNKILLKDNSSKYLSLISLTTLEIDDIELPVLKTSLYMIILIVIGAVLSGLFIFLIFSNKLNSLVYNSNLIKSMSEGKLTKKINYPSSLDEVGLISFSLHSFTEKFVDIVENNQQVSSNMETASESMSQSAELVLGNSQDQSSTLEEISAAIEQINAGANTIDQKTNHQTENVTMLSGKVNELSGIIEERNLQIIETSNKITKMSKDASEGKDSLDKMNISIQNIKLSSKKITGVVEIINGISKQINLLALNAAIEAARAGDSGRGFAVVADEIGRLAARTGSSIHNINTIIQQNEEEIELGSTIISNTIQLIKRIIEAFQDIYLSMETLRNRMNSEIEINTTVDSETKKMKLATDSIQLAMTEQKMALKEISEAIYNISSVIQTNVSHISELNDSSKRVANMAKLLKTQVDYFHIETNRSDKEFHHYQ